MVKRGSRNWVQASFQQISVRLTKHNDFLSQRFALTKSGNERGNNLEHKKAALITRRLLI
jgi:hypothetical protein